MGFCIYALAPTSLVFLMGAPVLALWGLAGPSAQGLMTRRVNASEQGRLQGAMSSIMGVTAMIGPGIFTQTFATFIGPKSPIPLPGAPYLLAASLLYGAMLVARVVVKVEKPV